MAPALRPSASPKMMSSASASSLVLLRTFWMSLPVRTPWAFSPVMAAMRATASACTVDTVKAWPPPSGTFTSKCCLENQGSSTPV